MKQVGEVADESGGNDGEEDEADLADGEAVDL